MSLEKIDQNARSIIETFYKYESTEQETSLSKGNKRKIEELNHKLKELKEYILKLVSEIEVLVKEEKKRVK